MSHGAALSLLVSCSSWGPDPSQPAQPSPAPACEGAHGSSTPEGPLRESPGEAARAGSSQGSPFFTVILALNAASTWGRGGSCKAQMPGPRVGERQSWWAGEGPEDTGRKQSSRSLSQAGVPSLGPGIRALRGSEGPSVPLRLRQKQCKQDLF